MTVSASVMGGGESGDGADADGEDGSDGDNGDGDEGGTRPGEGCDADCGCSAAAELEEAGGAAAPG
jgi:hypothetical protein